MRVEVHMRVFEGHSVGSLAFEGVRLMIVA